MSADDVGSIIHPRMYGWQDITSDAIGMLHKAATLPTSQECPSANSMLDEWVLLARALCDVIALS